MFWSAQLQLALDAGNVKLNTKINIQLKILQSAVCILLTVCRLHSVFCTDQKGYVTMSNHIIASGCLGLFDSDKQKMFLHELSLLIILIGIVDYQYIFMLLKDNLC